VFRKGGVARIARGPVALYARFVILDSGQEPELLQNCLVLINTILIQRTIERQKLWAQPHLARKLGHRCKKVAKSFREPVTIESLTQEVTEDFVNDRM